MKKIYALAAAAILLCASAVTIVIVKNNDSDSLFYANVDALADIENPIEDCERWCYMWYNGLCVLKTSAGYDINCIDMNPRNSF